MPFCYFNEKVGEHAVINCPLKTKLQQMQSITMRTGVRYIRTLISA